MNLPLALHALLRKRPSSSILLLARHYPVLLKAIRQVAATILGDDRPTRLRHPDYHELDALSVQGTADAARAWLATVTSHPFEGGRVVMAIHGADTLAPAAASALLKTVEEPPPATTLLLTATNIARLLPTIVSRVFRVYLPAEDHLPTDALRAGQRFLELVQTQGAPALRELLALPDLRLTLDHALYLAPNTAVLAALLQHLRLLDSHVAPQTVLLSLRRAIGTPRAQATAKAVSNGHLPPR